MPVWLLATKIGSEEGNDERQKKKAVYPELIYADEVEG